MNEKEIKDNIKALTVQIITPKEQGTGVLIMYQNKPYILTVHHVIYGKVKKNENIEADDVKFIFYNQAELYAISIKDIGELVLLELNSKELANFETAMFWKVEYKQEYYIRGFPTGLNEPHNFNAKCNDDAVDRERFKIELLDMTNDTSGDDAIEYMRGVSGSGVFFSKNKKLYLIGLVNALANQSGTFNAVECLNLRKLIKKRKAQKKSVVKKVFLLTLLLGVGGVALFYYLHSLESEALAPKNETVKEIARLKPSTPMVNNKTTPIVKEEKVVEKSIKSQSLTVKKKETPLRQYKGKPVIFPKDVTLFPTDIRVKPKNVMVYPINNTQTPLK